MPRPSELQLSASAAAMRIPIQRQFRGGHLGSFHSALRFPRDHRPASKMGLPRVFSWPFFGCDEAPCGNFRDVEIVVPCHPGTPSLSRAISHVFPIVQALKHAGTPAPRHQHPGSPPSLARWPILRSSFLFFHSLHCRALASILPLSPQSTTPYALSNSPFHSSAKSF